MHRERHVTGFASRFGPLRPTTNSFDTSSIELHSQDSVFDSRSPTETRSEAYLSDQRPRGPKKKKKKDDECRYIRYS